MQPDLRLPQRDGSMRVWHRPPQLHNPEPHWIPIRYVHQDVDCSFCGFLILRASPGSRTGERGTKAYFNQLLREFECIGCRQEALRVERWRLDHEQAEREAARVREGRDAA